MSDLFSEDPAAEFLQQEGDQLRELGIEEDQFNVPDPFAAAEPVATSAPAAASTAAPPAAAPAVTNEVNFIDEFETEITPQEPLVNGYPDLGMSDAPISVQQPIHMIMPSVEPESLGKWREEKAASLQQQVLLMFLFSLSIIVCNTLSEILSSLILLYFTKNVFMAAEYISHSA